MDALVSALTSKLQYAVSGDKIRYKTDEFDLDLTCAPCSMAIRGFAASVCFPDGFLEPFCVPICFNFLLQ